MIRRVFATGLKFDRGLRTPKILITVTTGDHQEFSVARVALRALLGLARMSLVLRTRLVLGCQGRCTCWLLDARKKTDVSRVTVRYSYSTKIRHRNFFMGIIGLSYFICVLSKLRYHQKYSFPHEEAKIVHLEFQKRLYVPVTGGGCGNLWLDGLR